MQVMVTVLESPAGSNFDRLTVHGGTLNARLLKDLVNTSSPLATKNSAAAIARDVAAVSRISAIPSILQIICENTGLGFAAVARVSDDDWTACAVQDNIGFGLKAGGQLDVKSTLCIEVKGARKPIVIDHASKDPVYCQHHTPRHYNIELHLCAHHFGQWCLLRQPLRD